MVGSAAKDEIQQRQLGLPPHLLSTSLLSWEGIAEVVRALSVGPGDTVLDLACGRGGYGLEIAFRTGAHLVGVDFSAEAVRQAREHAQRLDRRGARPRRRPRKEVVSRRRRPSSSKVPPDATGHGHRDNIPPCRVDLEIPPPSTLVTSRQPTQVAHKVRFNPRLPYLETFDVWRHFSAGGASHLRRAHQTRSLAGWRRLRRRRLVRGGRGWAVWGDSQVPAVGGRGNGTLRGRERSTWSARTPH